METEAYIKMHWLNRRMANFFTKNIKNSFSFVTRSEIVWLIIVYFVNVITALSEVGGIAMIYVFFSVLIDLENLGGISILTDIYSYLNFNNKKDFLILLASTVLVVFISRNAFQIWGVWINLFVRKTIQLRVANKIFNKTVHLSYSKLNQIHSSRLVADISSNSASAVAHCTLGIIEMLGSITLLGFFATILLFSKTLETLIALPFILLICLTYWLLLKKKLSIWGFEYIVATQKTYKNVTEAIYGIKSIKVYKSESIFNERFNKSISKQLNLNQISGFMSQVPKILIETVIIMIIMSAVIIFLINFSDINDLMATLVLFGGVAIRIVPAISRILIIAQQFKISSHALESIIETLNIEESRGEEGMSFSSSRTFDGIKLIDVWHRFSEDKWVLRGVDLSINPGSFVGFVGSSGSGKTTTADIILGLLKPEKGEVYRNIKNPHSGLDYSFVPQEPFILESSIKRNIAFGVEEDLIDISRVDKVIKLASLMSVVERFPKGLDSILGENGGNLSGGERQRFGIARALYFDAPVIVLDEPTSALDAHTEGEITDVILRLRGKKTIILIAHRLSTVAKCDQLFYFEDGIVKSHGNLENLTQNSVGFKAMLDKYKSGIQ